MPREYPPLPFAGIDINKTKKGYFLEENTYASKIDPLPKTASFEDFRTTQHLLAYITHTRLEFFTWINVLSQVTINTFQQEDIKIANALIMNYRN